MEIKKRKHLLFWISLVFVVIITYYAIQHSFQSISTISSELSYIPIVIVFSLIFSYYGILVITKSFLMGCSLWTQNKNILKSITIVISFFMVLGMLSIVNITTFDISNSDKGILFEIVGFFIYLNPVTKYVVKSVTSENEFEFERETMIKSSAISFVLIGLILQFSYFI